VKGKVLYNDFSKTLMESKRYWIIYLIVIALTCTSTITLKNLPNPQFVVPIFIIVAFLGVFCIVYYFRHDSEEELYKVAFVIIICFGMISALIVPIVDVSDELEHLTRAEITSQGVLFPHWESGENHLDRLYNHSDEGRYSSKLNTDVGFETSQSHMFFLNNRGNTVFDTDGDTDKISQSTILDGSAFEQNPFYGYLPQAIGVFIAKLFDMNVIWMLWLGRIFNLIFYAGIISLAVKKAPVLKIPLLSVACIPISIYQAASVSIDSMIIGLGILTVAYFIYLYKADAESLEIKEVAIFCGISFLLGLCKLPYLAFVFLILLVPKRNFKNKNILLYMLLGIMIVGALGVLWSTYSTPALMHSWRSKLNYMNPSLQLEFLINHPVNILYFLKQVFTFNLGSILNGFFNFFAAGNPHHYSDNHVFITVLIWIFLAATLLFYPNKSEFDFKARFGSLMVLLIVYVGTCFIQLLTWADVGGMTLGISTRYFLPLFALLPIIASWKTRKFDAFKENYDNYAMVFIIAFMATLILAFATKYYS
jgi:uncharacterized membrane protein